MTARRDLEQFISKLSKTYEDAVSPTPLKAIGNEATRLIVKRTRLGYSVDKQGTKSRLKPLSKQYVEYRKGHSNLLSNLTTPPRSNLTFTGQMLNSMQVVRVTSGSVVIGPKGYRDDGLSNEEVANRVNKFGRPFNNLSTEEQSQITRFYRRIFGDLVDRRF